MSEDWDCIVVGGGVAGSAAALVLGRARRRVLLLDRDGQSNRAAEHVGGLLGNDGTPPDELYARAREELAAYGTVEMRAAAAVDARAEDDGFTVELDDDGGTPRARRLVLATGMDYELPDLPDFREHWGRAVFHCPFCHGWEVRDRPLVVCGRGDVAERQSALLAGWSDDVTVVDPDDVAGLRTEDGALRAVVRHDGSEIPCEGVLVHAPLRRRGTIPESLGLAFTGDGRVEVDGFGRTSVPGVFAAGDLAVAPQQVAIALGSGHLAGVVVAGELLLGTPAMSSPG